MPAIGLVFWRFARMGFRRESRYLLAAVAGLVANVMFGFIKAAVLLNVVAANTRPVAGYTATTIGAYVWLSQGLLGAIGLFGSAEIAERIKTGDVAIDLIRPVDVQLSHLAVDLGRATFTLLPRGIPSVLVGVFTIGVTFPSHPAGYVLGGVSLLLGVTVSFVCRFALNIVGFWVLETRGLQTFYTVVSSFFSGLFVPVAFFPDWLHVVAVCSPFPSMLQTPIDVLSGRVTGLPAVTAIVVQIGWVVVAGLVGRVLFTAGRRRLEVLGG
jgi:ABC-2 type transport system permease protein